jgi:hypothetical protein
MLSDFGNLFCIQIVKVFFRKYSVNTSSRGREAIGRGDPGLSGLPRPAKSSGARNDGRILTFFPSEKS